MNKAFEVSDLYAEGWSLFKMHWKFVVLVTLVAGIIQGVFEWFGYDVNPVTGVATGSIPMTIIGVLVSIVLGIGMINIFLGLVRGEHRELKDLFTSSSVSLFFKYLGATIVYSLILIIGFILLIIPGLILMVMLMPYVYVLVDQEGGAIDSLKKARALTKGSRLDIFLLIVLSVILNIVGALVLLVGLLVTMPLTMFVFVLMYEKLLAFQETGGEDVVVVEEIKPEETQG